MLTACLVSTSSNFWITPKIESRSFCHSRHSLKSSERSVHNFLSYLANTLTDRQTDKQINSGKNITSLVEVIKYYKSRTPTKLKSYYSKMPLTSYMKNNTSCSKAWADKT